MKQRPGTCARQSRPPKFDSRMRMADAHDSRPEQIRRARTTWEMANGFERGDLATVCHVSSDADFPRRTDSQVRATGLNIPRLQVMGSCLIPGTYRPARADSRGAADASPRRRTPTRPT